MKILKSHLIIDNEIDNIEDIKNYAFEKLKQLEKSMLFKDTVFKLYILSFKLNKLFIIINTKDVKEILDLDENILPTIVKDKVLIINSEKLSEKILINLPTSCINIKEFIIKEHSNTWKEELEKFKKQYLINDLNKLYMIKVTNYKNNTISYITKYKTITISKAFKFKFLKFKLKFLQQLIKIINFKGLNYVYFTD